MVENTTHGSGWIVHIQPTQEARSTDSRIPRTGVGGSFKSSLQREAVVAFGFPLSLSLAAREREGEGISRGALLSRPNLNNPPTFPWVVFKEGVVPPSFVGWT